MNFQPYNAGRAFRRKADYVSEIGVQCDKYSTVFHGEAQDLFVCGS